MWKFGAAMDIGSRPEQQDRLTILKSWDGKRRLVAVADGMGGLSDGGLAAQIAVDTAARLFSGNPVPDHYAFLEEIFQTAHRTINTIPHIVGYAPGSTLVLLYLDGRHAYWAHVGDSRLYHFRNGRLLSQTLDHSLLELSLSQGHELPDPDHANALQSRLYMRLGGDSPPRPAFSAAKILDGDLFVLCSDGFWQAMGAEEIPVALKAHPANRDGAQFLVAEARKRHGASSDNISVVVFEYCLTEKQGWLGRFARLF